MTSPNQLDNDFEYKCTLSAEYQKIALELLGEDESTRNQALDQFREWIQKHANIMNCRLGKNIYHNLLLKLEKFKLVLDTSFLLRFLRMKRFYVPNACEILERYLLFRHNNPQWTKNLDVRDPEFKRLILSGYCFPLLKKTRSGKPIIFYNMAKLESGQFNLTQMIRVTYIMLELAMSEEETQVTGCTHIGDDSGISLALIASWPISEVKDFMVAYTKSLPLRHNKFCIVDLPSYASGFMQLILTFVSEKMKGRFEVSI